MITNSKTALVSILLPFLLLINACGGGGITVADGGITGTGITAGRITNFGSVFVNGIQFDVDNATFVRDGVGSQQSEFLVGEYVVIKGDVNTSGSSGTATEVVFNDILEGQVTTASTDGVSLHILGQEVTTDPLSVFHGFANLADLSVGNVVEVSGLVDATGIIVASSIELKQVTFIPGVSENEIKGIVSNVQQTPMTFQIGNITIDYSNAAMDDFANGIPASGQFVEAKSNQIIINNVLTAFEVELENDSLNLEEGTEAELEGLITRFVSTSDFDVNGINIETTGSTEFENGGAENLALNVLVEVEGNVNSSGSLVADKIKFRESNGSDDDNNEASLEGSIQSINVSSNEVVVSGTTIILDVTTLMIDKSDQEISPLTISDLAVGDNVDVRGITLSNGNVLATRLERDD